MKSFEPSDSLIIGAIVLMVLLATLTGCSREPKIARQMEIEAEIHMMKDKLDKGITPIHDDSNCSLPHE